MGLLDRRRCSDEGRDAVVLAVVAEGRAGRLDDPVDGQPHAADVGHRHVLMSRLAQVDLAHRPALGLDLADHERAEGGGAQRDVGADLGAEVEDGRLVLPSEPGLGVRDRS